MLVVTPVSGVTSTLVTTGLLFVTVTESVPWSVSPLESVAVTRQRMLSPGCTTDGESVSVFVVAEEILVAVPVPPVCFAHSYERVGVPPSGSVAVAVQVSVVLVVTDVSGEIWTSVTVGALFSMDTVSVAASTSPCVATSESVLLNQSLRCLLPG